MKKLLAIIAVVASLSGCTTLSPNAFLLSADQLARRNIETRKFSNIEEATLLSAAANVLQDMGFNLDNSEVKLGLITASKERDAINPRQIVSSLFVAALLGGNANFDKEQKFVVSLVIKPQQTSGVEQKNTEAKRYLVRVTFQRIVRRSDGDSYAETLKDQEYYSGFFEKLSKSVFIEGQKL